MYRHYFSVSVCGRVCADYLDYEIDDVINDCVISPLSVTDTRPVYVTAFRESRDSVACSNGSSASVHVISLRTTGGVDDVRHRPLPRIRVNVVTSASDSSQGQHTYKVKSFPIQKA